MNKNISVLNQSSTFHEILNDNAHDCPFSVNESTYTKWYYLFDEIYPEWTSFFKAFWCLLKHRKFKRFQESTRKDVRRTFNVRQGRLGDSKNATRFYKFSKLRRVMYASIILHNMIVEDKWNTICDVEDFYIPLGTGVKRHFHERVAEPVRENKGLKDKDIHTNLLHDLIQHIWKFSKKCRQCQTWVVIYRGFNFRNVFKLWYVLSNYCIFIFRGNI